MAVFLFDITLKYYKLKIINYNYVKLLNIALMEEIIKELIRNGFITFETVCSTWYVNYMQKTNLFTEINSDLLLSILNNKKEWINKLLETDRADSFQYDFYIRKSPLAEKVGKLGYFSAFSLLALAIAWEDEKAENTIKKLSANKTKIAVFNYDLSKYYISTDCLYKILKEESLEKIKQIILEQENFS